MKNCLFIIALLSWLASPSQSPEQNQPVVEEQLEALAGKSDTDVEDDSYWQKLNEYRKYPMNLNTAREEELQTLNILTDLQIKNFLLYRALLGKLITIYEMQAIPSWDMETVKALLPYISVNKEESLTANLNRRWNGGDHYLLLRSSEQLEKSKGFEKPLDSTASHYLGSRERIFFRYTYNYKNLMQYGILGDKDAGEQFFRGSQRYGFDFYSVHFFSRRMGIIRAFAVGDFTINMGQGLIQWQSLAFTKSAGVLAIKRQGDVLRPYHSAGEFNFHRGVGISLHKWNWNGSAFLSIKKMSTNQEMDTSNREDLISSFENSGYHRTAAENADRNNTKQVTLGGNISFSDRRWHVGINAIQYYFSRPIQKQQLPYNLFAIRGKAWSDFSTDYSFTYHNLHFFGEAATDRNRHSAFIQGALLSMAATIDIALLYRNINRAYQSLYADAFTENTSPNNEKGYYTGLSIRPLPGWRLDAFMDLYSFPWLKYRVDAPSGGRDFFVQLFYQPSKTWNIYMQYKNELKQINGSFNEATHPLAITPKSDWRTVFTTNLRERRISISSRFDCLWYDKKANDAEQGFLGLIDLFYQSSLYSLNLRLQYFESSGYNSRLYAFEHDVLYSFSLPAYFDKGFRYYFNLHARLNKLFSTHVKKMQCEAWIRWAQTIYAGKESIDSGIDEIHGNKKSEIKLQFMFFW